MIAAIVSPITRYMHWLHTRWPAGTVERLPHVDEHFQTNVTGAYITGDLTGIPLLKLSADSGAKAVRHIVDGSSFAGRKQSDDVLDVAIIGGGVSGFAAALEAKGRGLRFAIFEAAEPFSTIVNFPKAKPIYTYPTELTPAGSLQFHDKSDVKEGLLDDLREQTLEQGISPTNLRIDHVEKKRGVFELVPAAGSDVPDDVALKAHRVIIAIGRSGNFRKLGVPGEDKDKVYNRLHDPADHCDTNALVVGGGDSALETAIALAQCGARVTLSYRNAELTRPKPDNIEKLDTLVHDPTARVDVENVAGDRVTTPSGEWMHTDHPPGSINLMLGSNVQRIDDDSVVIKDDQNNEQAIDNDVVFAMIGREPPLEFFRRSGIRISGDRTAWWWISLLLMLATFTFLYQWKKPGTWLPIAEWFQSNNWFPHNIAGAIAGVFADPANPLGTLAISAFGQPGKTDSAPGFWFSLLYCTLIVIFGIKRIKRRKTPYIKWQTITLMTIQCVPLFVLPYLLFPWLGHLGVFDSGIGKAFADALFPAVEYDPHGREYWRAFGLILAWPLFLWNVFTNDPIWAWLIISLVQTFVLIPIGIYFYGKGIYCGWICSCGAMAETLGDTHRHKMPHGPAWNRLNMIGQVFLALALAILGLRVLGWCGVGWASAGYTGMLSTNSYGGWLPGLNYAWFVDLLWAGILGFGLYFHFSGRVWCRFACPLAALMHIYARFSRFAIVTEKKKCISCNVCTSVCHQGIDVMSFANKGKPMIDPECVRCSACVQSCPTGVLSFGQVSAQGDVIARDPSWLAASPVRMTELTISVKRS